MAPIIVLTSVSLLMLVIVGLCASGAIPRNRVVGIRIASLYSSDHAWREGHRAAVLPIALGAAAAVGLTVACGIDRSLQDFGPLIVLVPILVSLGVAVWLASRATRA